VSGLCVDGKAPFGGWTGSPVAGFTVKQTQYGRDWRLAKLLELQEKISV
jgi:hypothetical protein